MKIVRRTRIAVRTVERLLIRMSTPAPESWCEGCGAMVRWVTPDQAAAFASVGPSDAGRGMEQGRLHRGTSPDGASLICLNSLVRQIQEYASEKEKTPCRKQS
jgi:hypothetical protein